jgi:hypothetical protein
MADYVLEVSHDDSPESPMEWDGQWTFVDFNDRHIHYKDPDQYLIRGKDGVVGATIGLRRKMQVGLAFIVSCYEHGSSLYSLLGKGTQCQWDTTQYAGMLIWEHPPKDMGAKTYEDRKKDAESFLDTYNKWANGWVYGYSLETLTGKLVDSCWGFYEAEYMTDQMDHEFKPGDRIKITGDSASFVDDVKWPEGVEIVDDFDDDDTAAALEAEQPDYVI